MVKDDKDVVADIEVAGRLLTDTINKDSRFAFRDLQDALESARLSSHRYAIPPKEWPPFVEVINARELPPVLIERYNAAGGQGTALCGIFPQIRRAWATVDDTLFLWRIDKWDGQCPEYNGEEQAICAVGLAKVRPGVFIEAIKYVIVLATPVELVLLGVCCSGSIVGDPFGELTLQPLPEYTIATDGTTMTCITSTELGRIFLGGRDGHLYELLYSTGSGWQSRCRKVCHTGGLTNMLSRWVVPNSLKFGASDAIVEVVVDEERNILYTRTQGSKLQMFDLGKSGDGAPKKVAEESHLCEQKDSWGGSYVAARASKTNLVSIAPISTVESKWLHVVATTSDGRRIYLSTFPLTGSSFPGFSGTHRGGIERPSVLRVVLTQPAPCMGASGGNNAFGSIFISGQTQTEGGSVIKAEAAYYSSGALVLSDASPPTVSRLLVATRDLTSPAASSTSGSLSMSQGATVCSPQPLREVVTVLGVEGRALAIADILPPPDRAAALDFSTWNSSSAAIGKQVYSETVHAHQLWACGELATQHMLPRRRAIILSTMGLMELVFNRPVDLLQKILETNNFRTVLEDFFQRFGAGEAAAMCLLLAAKLTPDDENGIPGLTAERAGEAFEDQRLVGLAKMQVGGGTVTRGGVHVEDGFNMGRVVEEAEPVFSGAHEGLCLCTARLLRSVWELPIMDVKKEAGGGRHGGEGILTCRLSVAAMQALEGKIRSLEQFLRARRNQRRGHYGRVMCSGEMFVYDGGHGSPLGGDAFARGEITSSMTGYLTPQPRGAEERVILPGSFYQGQERQDSPFKELSPAKLTTMEVRGMECIRRLLRRSGEALRLLQLLQQHHIGRLAQTLDKAQCHELAQLTFHQLVCSAEGEEISTRLVAALMEYYVAPTGKGTVDDISMKLREGCPSYYNESDHKFYQAVESLERAATTSDAEQKDRLAKEALELLSEVPETADLLSICQRFEDIGFYEAVVELPLRKARALDPLEDAFNPNVEESRREAALAARRQCYEVITSSLWSLKGKSIPENINSKILSSAPGARLVLDEAARENYIRQIVQLGVREEDHGFHECLYETMIELGLTQDLLELGGHDLERFLQNAGSYQTTKASQISKDKSKSPISSTTPNSSRLRQPISGEQAKYLELLSRLYIHRRQHALASHVLLRLAERRQVEGSLEITLQQRYDYLSNAVVQARSGSRSPRGLGQAPGFSESGFLEVLESKLAVLRFQLKIKEMLDLIASAIPSVPLETGTTNSQVPTEENGYPSATALADENRAQAAREKSEELNAELKSITQLYNDFAVPFELWEVCLEILNFSNYSGDAENSVMQEMWTRLLDQALSKGGVGEACSVVQRVGPLLYPGDGGIIPLHTITLLLEMAAHEKTRAGTEMVGDEDVPRALLAACKGDAEPVQRNYDLVLANGAILPKPSLRLRLLRSVLAVMREWTVSVLKGQSGGSFLHRNSEKSPSNQGIRDKLASTANQYMTEVRRLALSPMEVEPVSQGFRELEEMLQGNNADY